MKNSRIFILIGVLILFSFALIVGCGGKKMSDEDFTKITEEYISEVMRSDFNQSITNPDEIEVKAKEVLKKICEKYGYTASDYEKKAEEFGKKLEQK